ncbi:MAG: DNA gyrase subunit A, partial [bacterium]
ASISEIISQKSKAMWGEEPKKAAICQALSNQEVRAKISANSRNNWQNPNYRARYPVGHFSNMAKLLWQNPETFQKHSDKIAQQRQDPVFIEAQRLGVQTSNKRRLLNNPNMMSEMAKLSAQTLQTKWSDPNYKQNIIQQKIALYVSKLIATFGLENVTPNLYESARDANWIPNLPKALTYFQNFDSIIDAGKTYNHRVVSKKLLEEKADVYDITVDTHHNFLLADGVFVHNSVDGDAPAAMRYTEIRMAKISDVMLADIDKETVDFNPNYDETLLEPRVLPARFPNLLVNGAAGIAVGMATNIPPHNLTEILEATILLVQKPETTLDEIIKIVPGPDFPTSGFILGRDGIRQAYETGRGSVIMRARAAIDRSVRNEAREAILVTQIPYQVNKARLIERIAELINDKKIEDISDLRDESDREGMRIVIELKRGAVAQVVLNNLYKLTAMQTSFGIINLSIVAGQPRVLGLLETLRLFISFRKEVVRRRSEFELRKARARQHILLGLIKALDHLDEIIKLIRASRSSAEAKEGLVNKFEFSTLQAQAILDLQLHRLTGMEKEKILNELREVERRIAELEEILNNENTLKTLIIKELREVQKEFGNERRTQILEAEADLRLEDLIPDEDMVITVTHGGYIKRTPLAHYRSQRRGGTGKKGMTTRTEDIVSHIFIASNHSYILIFSDKGQAYTLKVHEIPDVSASGKGKAMVNLINLPSTEKVAGVLSIRGFAKDQYVVMVTRRGTTKKTELADFAYSRARGIIAINIDDGDELIATELSDGKKKIFIATHSGMAIYFNESDVRSVGRQAYGVKGIDLRDNDYVVGVAVVTGTEQMLTISQYGLGKRTTLEDYRFQSRGGIGVINMKVTDKTGPVVAVMPVRDDNELMIISGQGKVIRFDVEDIRETGRNTQGVRLIDTADEDYVASASLIERQDSPILETSEPPGTLGTLNEK